MGLIGISYKKLNVKNINFKTTRDLINSVNFILYSITGHIKMILLLVSQDIELGKQDNVFFLVIQYMWNPQSSNED